MNILIPHQWLLEHLETTASPEKIQETLSLCGPSVEKIETIKDEAVYDVEVTTNRVDSASVRGIAREAATILPEFDIQAKLLPLKTDAQSLEQELKALPQIDLTIQNDPQLCKRIMAVTLEVTVKESPEWLKKRLEQVGQRPLNNLIDITNYVMWSLGHPTHVFDLDKFTQKSLIVREAKPGESIVTLDKKNYKTVGGEVILDDGTGTIIDMPGLMGTDNTIVDENTKRVLFFIDSVDAEKIRFASMTHNIRTQAAILNEKHVDPGLAEEALYEGIRLFFEIADAKLTSQVYDYWPDVTNPKPIRLTQKLIDTYLGLAIDSDRIIRILENLGCVVKTVEAKSDFAYEVIPPTFRAYDLQIPQDIIEEVARIYGYHNLPSVLMDTPIPDVDTNLNHPFEHIVKNSLADWGASEVYSYSLVSQKLVQDSGYPENEVVKLSNPLTEDLVYLRPSLIPSHHEIFEQNKNNKDWSIFEMANVYWKNQTDSQNSPISEVLILCISNNTNYTSLKSLVDNLLKKIRVPDISFKLEITKENSIYSSDLSAIIYSGTTELGTIGLTKLGIYSATLGISNMLSVIQTHPTYQQLSSTSPIIQDMTFQVPVKTNIGQVIAEIKASDQLVSEVTLKDTYKQNFTFTIEYLDRDTQLTLEDVLPLRERIEKILKTNFKAKLIGKSAQ